MNSNNFIQSSKSVFLLFFFFVHYASAQDVKEPNFQSANSASLGRFGDIPVSYHTGVPKISIPIFTIKEGDLSVPITLSYHSNGVKVDEVASWVGLSWNLSAGGSIARTIIGGPDEGKTITWTGGSACGYRGWYKDYGIPSCMNLDAAGCGSTNPADGRGSGADNTCYAYYMAASRGTIDMEPDLYSFNFPGGSGKFLFDNARKAHMIPENDFYIKPEEEPNLFRSWKIISPDGTKYFFGGTDATENNYSKSGYAFTPTEDDKASTTWYLTRIESANGKSWIQLEYEPEKYSYGTKSSQFYARSIFGFRGSYTEATGMTLTNVIGVRLSRITTSSGYTQVDFIEKSTVREDLTSYEYGTIPNNEAKALQKIQISYGDKCKVFTLNTDYFSSDRSNPFGITPETVHDAKRLKLISVQESTCASTLINPPYQFTYSESVSIPRRYSFSLDHWGYYNAKPNTTILPPFIDPANGQSRPGADRNPDEIAMKAGILTRITYPMGGYTDFDYEAHRESPSSPTIIGGLRVKSITDNDGNGKTITRNFNYLTGILYAQPTYSQNPNLNPYVLGGVYDFGIIFSSSPNPPLQATHGYHVGYSVVEVEYSGNGKSVYRYHNTHPLIISNQFPQAPTIAVIGTANLFKEEHFDATGGLKQSTEYLYASTGGDVLITARRVRAMTCFNTSEAAGCQFPYPIFNDYVLSTFRHHLTQKTDVKDGITTVTNYTYDTGNKHNNPKSIAITNSDGVVNLTESIYPSDTGSGAPAAMADPSDPNFKNMLGAVVEQKNFISSSLTAKVNNQFTQSGSKVLLTSTKSYPTGTTDFVEDQYEYDASSNIVNIKKSDGVNNAILWGYNNSYPIASVQNGTLISTGNNISVVGTSVSANTSSCTTIGSFAIAEPRTVTFDPSVELNDATGLWIKLTLKDAGGAIKFGPKQYTANGTYQESVALPPGSYTFCYEAGGYPVPYTGYSAINFIVYAGNRSTIFHTSFEETGITDATSKTGAKVWNGTYPVTMPHINGDYILSYWKKQNIPQAQWVYQEQPVTISSANTPDYVIGESGYLVDEVRLYPKGAIMETYTYEPGLGIKSMADPNHIVSYYFYDDLSRLKTVKDSKGNIVKNYQYHYKGQN